MIALLVIAATPLVAFAAYYAWIVLCHDREPASPNAPASAEHLRRLQRRYEEVEHP